MVVGCLVENEGKILMARRGIEPRKGYWNLPCGFLENNESVEEGAQREVFEETGARVDLLFPHCVYNLTKAQQVYFIFLARMNAPEYHLTEESTEISFFDENDMPWDEIAFTSNIYALRKYFGKEEKEREQLFLASYPDIA
jgi:ADP-ribose pyrophosphatase YjhB (NUDIX family)